jgi:methionyl-tRNA formyltransferase
MSVRTVFMGSPEFALPALRLLSERYPVVGVVTQPDRPAGRGRVLTPPPVKVLAEELGLPVIQPRRLRQPEALEQLRSWQPELIVVAAFGQILRAEVLDLPAYGCINVHASLLPRWRGAAPIQAAILNGDEETGATIMLMDPGVDTGPVLAQRALAIEPGDTAGSLSERLAQAGARLLVETLPGYLSGEIVPRPQEELPGEPSYAPMLKKADGRLDFNRPAVELARQVRAFNPWPGAFFEWQGQLIKVHRAWAIDPTRDPDSPALRPGGTGLYQDLPVIGASPGLLALEEVQPPGKVAMPAKAFRQGARGWGEKGLDHL